MLRKPSTIGWLLSAAALALLLSRVASAVVARRAARRRWLRAMEGGVAVVTGASAGIGRELALLLAPRVGELILTGTRESALHETRQLCEARGAAAVTLVVGDITTDATIDELGAAIRQRGRLDVLALNAGVGHIAPFANDEASLTAVRRLMDVNFFANIRVTQAALGALRASEGRILVISSLSGFLPTPNRTAYCASKHAVNGFFGALRNESGLVVTIACPSWVATGFHDRALARDAAAGADMQPSHASGRFMSPATCAAQALAALERGELQRVMTASGKVANVLFPIFPSLISDIIRARVARAHSDQHAAPLPTS